MGRVLVEGQKVITGEHFLHGWWDLACDDLLKDQFNGVEVRSGGVACRCRAV